jgi:Flp pilus assembly protein TadG
MAMFKRFLSNAGGSAGIMAAAAAVPLMLSAGLAIDMVRMSQTRSVLQAAADAAAIAGATSKSSNQGNLNTVVQDYLKANGAEDALTQVTGMSQWTDSSNATFNVKIDGRLNTSLMRLAGVTSMDISVGSQVNLGQQSLEMALVLDNTGSMAGAKIDSLKTSAKELVRIINSAKSDYSSLKVAVVPFGEYVNVGPKNASANWVKFATAIPAWEGCVGSRNSPLDEQQGYVVGSEYTAVNATRCTAPILPLTSDILAINKEIDAMTAEGNTFVPGGLLWGWNALTADEPFMEGMTPTQLKAKNGRKVIVLMTDGTNTISPAYPEHVVGNTALSDQKLATICGNVKADDYTIYTVSFMVTDVNIKQLLTNCASATENAFDADNSTELYLAFQSIGQQLASIRITQ